MIELSHPIETPNNIDYRFHPKTLEETKPYFRRFLEDWREATSNLDRKGFIYPTEGTYRLTPAGEKAAIRLRLDRPPIYYWFNEYYLVTAVSQANALLCERLYGKNLNQQGFMDMAQLDKLLEVTRLGSASRVLDLGCGSGQISEYISDLTSSFVSGMDYIPEAVRQAQGRTLDKVHRLEFRTGNLDHLDYPAGSFDTILAIDTLYMPNDLVETLRQMKRILTAKGQMAIFYGYALWEDPQQISAHLLPDHTPLGEALTNLGLEFQTYDFTQADYQHALIKKKVADELRTQFEEEGNLFLYYSRMAEAEGTISSYKTGSVSRYLYHVIC